MNNTDKIIDLDNKFKKMSSEELAEVLYLLVKTESNEKIIRIVKTYLFRRLHKEGIS